jgi:hypothetical protein
MIADKESEEAKKESKPKTFISYSWSSQAHRDRIRQYAERLIGDNVDVVLDQWDLREGQDKNAFMEKMVTDPTVTHVLVFSDKQYAIKADKRKAGVGTESQIISQEVYKKVDQKKFIPIACELDENGEAYLPTFFAARIWIDFSSPEKANENWEQLIRLLYGQPLHEKPSLGKTPSYISETTQRIVSPTVWKLATLKNVLLNDSRRADVCRNDFLDAAIAFADTVRVRGQPDIENLHEKIVADLRLLLPLRDDLIDWIVLESGMVAEETFAGILTEALERILALRYRPADVTTWNNSWFDALRIFVYETFIYTIAALVRNNRFRTIHELLTANYLLPASEAQRQFDTFDEFYGYSETLTNWNRREKKRRISPVADLMKERATRTDLDFAQVMQADLVIFLGSLVHPSARWYPQTIIYAGYGRQFPLFIRAARHRYFRNLAVISGIESADSLREAVKVGYERVGATRWTDISWHSQLGPLEAMNPEKWDTLD